MYNTIRKQDTVLAYLQYPGSQERDIPLFVGGRAVASRIIRKLERIKKLFFGP